jgi:hypothetical protein
MAKRKSPFPLDDLQVLATPRGLAMMLWAIREYGPLTCTDLLTKVIGSTDMDVNGTMKISLRQAAKNIGADLMELATHGFISLRTADDKYEPLAPSVLNAPPNELLARFGNIAVEVTEALEFVQTTFDLSLTDFMDDGIQMRFEPSFGNPVAGQWPEIFVVMPFRPELNATYDNILSVARGLGVSCKRGDEFFSDDEIMKEIWSAMWHSRLCIVDCTGRNANVFYELGIAHTIGKKCILLAQSEQDLPFDVQHRRVIIYQTTPKGQRDFRDIVGKAIQEELGMKTDKLDEIFGKLR